MYLTLTIGSWHCQQIFTACHVCMWVPILGIIIWWFHLQRIISLCMSKILRFFNVSLKIKSLCCVFVFLFSPPKTDPKHNQQLNIAGVITQVSHFDLPLPSITSNVHTWCFSPILAVHWLKYPSSEILSPLRNSLVWQIIWHKAISCHLSLCGIFEHSLFECYYGELEPLFVNWSSSAYKKILVQLRLQAHLRISCTLEIEENLKISSMIHWRIVCLPVNFTTNITLRLYLLLKTNWCLLVPTHWHQ